MNRFQRFVLGMSCAQQVLKIMALSCGDDLRGLDDGKWSRSLERLWVDARPADNRHLQRGARWLKWAGLVEIKKIRWFRRTEKFISLTDAGRLAALQRVRTRKPSSGVVVIREFYGW